jgi:glutaredoxin
MFNCSECDYKTERKYNLQSHTRRKHERELKEEEKVKKEDKEEKDNDKNYKNNNNLNKNNNNLNKNNNNLNKNNNIKSNNIFKCDKCSKILKTKQGLNYHINICKGVLNPLECPYCHKIYALQQSKSQHLKTCRVKMSSLIEVKKKEEENKQTTIINNGTINNNITIINFNYNDYIEFIRSHINAEEMNKMLKESKNEEIIIEYFNKLYKNPLNRCIKRESERNGKSKIKIGEEWKEEMNKVVYPKLSLSVSKSLNEHLDDLMDEEKIKKSLSNIASDISILTDDIIDKAPNIEIEQLKKRIIKTLQFKLLSY